MNDIDRFSQEALESAETVAGETFRWPDDVQGNEYSGIFSEVDKSLDQQDEGYYIDADYEVVVRRNQFSNTEPKATEKVFWKGRRFVIRDIQEDNVHLTLALKERRIPNA